MLATTGSFELREWVVELTQLRPEDEKRAYENAKREAQAEAGTMD